MKRRAFIAGLGGAAAWPVVARAQQPDKIYRIGFLANDPNIPTQPTGQAFLEGLRQSGFVEGKNVIIERRFAEGKAERYSELARELAQLGVDVLVTSTTAAILAAKHATTSIPIVMLNADPIEDGIVGNLAHPEANVTGLADSASAEISGKRLQLLKDAVPGAVRVAVLMSPNSSQAEGRFLELAAQSLNVALSLVSMHQADDIPNAFDEINRTRPDAMLVPNSALIISHRKPIVEHAVDSRIPAIFGFREAAEIGGLLSYGGDRVDVYRRAADFAAKILKGAKPGDLPIEQPTKYELVINLKTAKALNLEVPRSLLLIADEVIE